ncbi:MAG: hypothetical protein F9K29_17915 [Hyphomicrobiaceae bacterium]|nr:MAG: hypothetical protein F9K29_17915 [Hyphomicrobiaceae bacterium]
MDLHWRGWGISVALLFAFWIFVAIALVVFASPFEPDPRRAMLDVQWLFAGMFALHALSVFAVVQYRRRHPPVAGTADDPHADEFMFIRLDLWPSILLGVAALFAGASWLGYPLLN